MSISPIIEIQHRRHRAKTRMFLCVVDPRHGKVITSRLLGSTLTVEQIAERTLSFTQWALAWFNPSYQFPTRQTFQWPTEFINETVAIELL